MIETTKETCFMCGKEYNDAHIVPRAPFAPYWCEECEAKVNAECGGWVSAVYHASKNSNPYEEPL